MSIIKLIAAPAAIPLALSVVIAIAGPGGPVEVSENRDPRGVTSGPEVTEAAATEPDAPVVIPQAPADAVSTADAEDGKGCIEALTERAESRPELREHAGDPSMPEGGVSGNQNALDSQCGGAFAADSRGKLTAGPSEPPAPAAPADASNGAGSAISTEHRSAEKPAAGNGP